MITKIATKVNRNGWRWELEIDTEKKTYKCGSFFFHSADVSDLTKKQLKQIEEVLLFDGFTKEGKKHSENLDEQSARVQEEVQKSLDKLSKHFQEDKQ